MAGLRVCPRLSVFRQFRCYRVTPKRTLILTLVMVVSMATWNSWMTITNLSSFHHLPDRNALHPPSPSPSSRPGSKYALGNTISVCSELVDQTAINKTRLEFLRNAVRVSSSERVDHLKGLLTNCTALKSRHSYWRWPVTPQEQRFPLAFGFKVHDAPDMFERLLRAIWRPHNLYIIHVDWATPNDTFQIVQGLASCFDNVQLTGTRINVAYASVLSLHADVECVKVALRSPVPWKYYLSVSGHEFPLKTNLEMVQILSFLNGTNDVENYRPAPPFSNFLKNASVIRGKNTFLTSRRRVPFKHDVTLRKGSAYFASTRPFLDWVLASPVCQDFLAWLNETWAADEMFWATANYLPHAPGGGTADVRHSDDSFVSRAMAWQWDRYKCQGHYVRRVCVFGAGDLKWLLSRPELIANKFDNSGDPLVLDCLERSLEERAERGFQEVKMAASSGGQLPPLVSTLDWAYYKALPHVRGRGSAVKPG